MKQITLILGDGYDDVVSVTAIGHSEISCGIKTQVLTAACEAIDGDTLYFPQETKPRRIRKDGEWKELKNE